MYPSISLHLQPQHASRDATRSLQHEQLKKNRLNNASPANKFVWDHRWRMIVSAAEGNSRTSPACHLWSSSIEGEQVYHRKKGKHTVIVAEFHFLTWHYLREALGVNFPPALSFLFYRWCTWPSKGPPKNPSLHLTLLFCTKNMAVNIWYNFFFISVFPPQMVLF